MCHQHIFKQEANNTQERRIVSMNGVKIKTDSEPQKHTCKCYTEWVDYSYVFRNKHTNGEIIYWWPNPQMKKSLSWKKQKW